MRRLLCIAALCAGLMAGAQQPKIIDPAPTPPAITREALEQRIAALKTQYDQAIANANALQGAIQDCQYWLDQFKATDEAKAKKDYDKDHPAPQPKP